MSKIQVNEIVNHFDNGAPDCPRGLTISGVATATSLELTSLDVTGNVSVGGTLTYDDVTSIDSVGIITAQSGIEFGASGVGGTITSAGAATFAKYVTASESINGRNIQAGGGSSGNLFYGASDTGFVNQVFKVTTAGAATFAGEVKVEGSYTPAGLSSRISRYGSLLIGTTSEAVGDARVSIDSGNGNGTFTGTIQSGGNPNAGTAAGTSINEYGTVRACQTSGSSTIWEGYTKDTGTTTSSITAAGAATFAGDVISGGDAYNGANNGCRFYSPGQVLVSRTGGTNTVFEGYTTGNSTSTTKITAAGAATFAAAVNIGDNTGSSSQDEDGIYLDPNGAVYSFKAAASTTPFFQAYKKSSGLLAEITHSGVASFASHIYTGSKYSNGTGGFLSSFGSLLLRCDDGSDYINFYTGGNGSEHVKVKITNAGAATFAGNVTTGDADYSATGVGGVEITANGYINAQRINTGSSDHHALYQGYHGNVMTFITRADGDVENANNSYGQYSDIKLKENVVDASSQWNNIKDIRVRNFNFIEGQTHTQIGVIAQEIETVSPGLVSESPDTDNDGNDLGTVTKSVKYSVLYMKAIKALQEAMTRIETLETQNADLLSRVTALEGS